MENEQARQARFKQLHGENWKIAYERAYGQFPTEVPTRQEERRIASMMAQQEGKVFTAPLVKASAVAFESGNLWDAPTKQFVFAKEDPVVVEQVGVGAGVGGRKNANASARAPQQLQACNPPMTPGSRTTSMLSSSAARNRTTSSSSCSGTSSVHLRINGSIPFVSQVLNLRARVVDYRTKLQKKRLEEEMIERRNMKGPGGK